MCVALDKSREEEQAEEGDQKRLPVSRGFRSDASSRRVFTSYVALMVAETRMLRPLDHSLEEGCSALGLGQLHAQTQPSAAATAPASGRVGAAGLSSRKEGHSGPIAAMPLLGIGDE